MWTLVVKTLTTMLTANATCGMSPISVNERNLREEARADREGRGLVVYVRTSMVTIC